MASIYRTITTRGKNKLGKCFCLLLTALLLFTLTGCSKQLPEPEEEISRAEEQLPGKSKNQPEQDHADDIDTEREPEGADSDGRVTMSQLMGNNTGDSLEGFDTPDTVLWFNATYAPLTYSNGANWRLVGGLVPNDTNARSTSIGLESSWNIEDRESALEQIKWLQEEGHRATWRKYLDEMEELGWLDLNTEEFADALFGSDKEENLFRYVMVYSFYQEGEDEESITAWDLIRINQLYGDFYVCGYMTYEEAMDASLENSLILQEMYDSWDEMMASYLLGYEFWQSDPMIDDDSPTAQRYGYYEKLLKMEDGPYTLDWDMELKKEW